MGGTDQWVPATPSLDEDAREDLLNFIEERRVIPIVGPELLTIDTAELPQPFTLNDVVCWFLAARERGEDTYARVRSILRELEFPPPAAT